MWIVSKSRLREFWEAPGQGDSQRQLRAWHTTAKRADWQNFADLKATYGNAGFVGDCVVFNIAGNKYRLVARIRYPSHKVYILKVMTHAEYDTGKWKVECGCYSPSPAPVGRPTKQKPVKRKKRRGR